MTCAAYAVLPMLCSALLCFDVVGRLYHAAYAVLCCAVLCCAVLPVSMLCFAFAVLGLAGPCYAP